MSDEIQAMGYGWPIWRAAKEDTRPGTKPTDSAEIVPDRVRELERERFEKWRATWNVGYAPDEWTVWQAAKEDGVGTGFEPATALIAHAAPTASDRPNRYSGPLPTELPNTSAQCHGGNVAVKPRNKLPIGDDRATNELPIGRKSKHTRPLCDLFCKPCDTVFSVHEPMKTCTLCDGPLVPLADELRRDLVKVEKRIAELERENAELKTHLELTNEGWTTEFTSQTRIKELERENGHLKRSDSYIIGQLLQCVEEAEGLIDGGDITRKAEKHVKAWLKRQDDLKLHMKKSQADTYDLATRLGAECEELREMLTGADRQLADAWKERDELREECRLLADVRASQGGIINKLLAENERLKLELADCGNAVMHEGNKALTLMDEIRALKQHANSHVTSASSHATSMSDFPSSEFRKWFDTYSEHGGTPPSDVCARWGWDRRDPSELVAVAEEMLNGTGHLMPERLREQASAALARWKTSGE